MADPMGPIDEEFKNPDYDPLMWPHPPLEGSYVATPTLHASTALGAMRVVGSSATFQVDGQAPDREMQLKRIEAGDKIGKWAHERYMADVEIIKKHLGDERFIERGVFILSAIVILGGLILYTAANDNTGITVGVVGGFALLSYLAGRKSPRKPTG